ncbi:MAG: hypothetical protein JSW28_08250 [Thermoplasmata archaeon]|nr:MAG: hypothetical protein JSW28_08250 [Thermoplasmata archaeon]
MTDKKKRNSNLFLGVYLMIIGMIVIGIAGSYISMNPLPMQGYAFLGGFIAFLAGLIMVILGIIQNHYQRRRSE